MVYIPTGNATLHGQGKYGLSIGANIACRYEDGLLTTKTLWDLLSGAFRCGVDVLGTGNRRQNVHGRLHVGSQGCAPPTCELAVAKIEREFLEKHRWVNPYIDLTHDRFVPQRLSARRD